MTAEFDEYTKVYEQMHLDNIRVTGEEPSYFADYKIQQLRVLAVACPHRVVRFDC